MRDNFVIMNLEVTPKPASRLYPTDILFQTSFWGRVKRRLGWEVEAFEISRPSGTGDMMALTRPLDDDTAMACVPQGPEHGPDPEDYGRFLEELSDAISRYLDPACVFIRYDPPWADPYALDGEAEGEGAAAGLWRPENRLREIRMNFSTRQWNLRKAPLDLTVADSLVLDLAGSEEQLLNGMKPKTRYNVRLAGRKGVEVVAADAAALPAFYGLYLETCRRNRFPARDYAHFAALFDTLAGARNGPTLAFYLALHGSRTLAGAIVARSGKAATYLFGASSSSCRNLMAPYAVQWHAIREARRSGCLSYDMGAVSALRDPLHPFYGLYRFKTGFGGRIEHRVGSWDFPIDPEKYESFRSRELQSHFCEAALPA